MFETQEPQSHYIQVDGHEVHVSEWGIDNPQPILMWHGLARTGRDFDPLAKALSDRYRIICPDTPGRGLSQWADDPTQRYCFDFYEKVALKVCEIFGLFSFDYIGTSMGGALGMRLAAGPLQQNINHLIINDIGPQLPNEAVERILTYVGNPPSFDSLDELEDYLRTVYEPYGYLPDEQWRLMCETSYRRMDNGRITTHYDPQIIAQFQHHPDDYQLWDHFKKINCPTLVLRGKMSDLLLPDWAEEMANTGPKAQVVEIEGCGHAPALNKSQHIQIVEEFLKG